MPFSAFGSCFRFRRSWFALGIAASLSGVHAAEPAGSVAVPPVDATQSAPLGTPQTGPQKIGGLSADVLYMTMLGEIAAARKRPDLGAELYTVAAQRTQDARIAQRATELGLASGQIELTGKAARLWASLDPKASNALQALALALSGEMAKLEDMEPPLRRMLDSETAPTEVFLLQLPSLLVRYPDKAAALAMVERLTQPYLEMPEAHFVRSVMALSANDLVKAERESRKALDQRPDWEAAARVRAQAAPKARQAQAMEELGRFGKRYPQSVGAREDYARWLVKEGRKAEAKEAYERLRADFPNNDDVVFGAVVMMIQGGESDQAEPLLRRLIDHSYRDVDQLNLQLGLILEASKPDEAVASYRAVQPGAQYFMARARAAQVLVAQGKQDEARAVLSEAIAQNPGNAAGLALAQAGLLRQSKQTAAALDLLEKYLVNNPDEHEVLYQAGMLAEELGRYDLMERRLRRLTVLKPDQSSAFNALGYSFADRNIRLAEADRLLSHAIKLSPEEAAIVDSMGWLRFRQNKLKVAAQLLRKAYKLQADPEIAAHLGEVLWKQGRRSEARSILQQARKGNPDSAALIEVMNRLLK